MTPLRWDPAGTWSIRLRIIDDILIILLYGKASRFCNIYTNLSSGLFRGVLWVEYGCAILLTASLLFTKGPWMYPPFCYNNMTNFTVCASAPRSIKLVASLAALLISTATWRHTNPKREHASVSFQCLAQIRIS